MSIVRHLRGVRSVGREAVAGRLERTPDGRWHLIGTSKKGKPNPLWPDARVISPSAREAAARSMVDVLYEPAKNGVMHVRLPSEDVEPAPEPEATSEPEQPNLAEPVPYRARPLAAGTERFHNPYAFIPFVRRDGPDTPATRELFDRSPYDHGVYHDGAWSGRLDVRMTVETPLLLVDPARARADEAEALHRILPVRKQGRRPLVAPTAIKGMLRAAYEAVTNSRVGVLEDHNKRLAFRQPVEDALDWRPVHVRDGQVHFMRAARVKPGLLDAHQLRHGAHALARLDEKRRMEVEEFPRNRSDVEQRLQHLLREGRVVRTNLNIETKNHERFFYPPRDQKSVALPGPVAERWRELIEDYRGEHQAEKERRLREGPPPDQRDPAREPGYVALSRHILVEGEELERLLNLDDVLAYARVENGEVVALFPVSVSRELYPRAPIDLFDESLKPATSRDQLSPADRVFGWVAQGKGKKDEGPDVAHRGQLRIGPVGPPPPGAVTEFAEPLPLAILSSPKPQQVRFYVGQFGTTSPATVGPVGPGHRRDAGYTWHTGRHPRGRKVYPHHRGLPDDHWDVRTGTGAREYRRQPEEGKDRDRQNRSVTGWVVPGSEFRFTLRFTNLSEVELGALLWLLDLPPEHFFRLGAARPLGFGSVRLDLERAVIESGAERRARYRAFGQGPAETANPAAPTKESFMAAVGDACGAEFEQVPFIAAFLRAAGGVEAPVHYPRSEAAPDPKGESFEWFVANEASEDPRSLPDLVDEHGGWLPVLPRRKAK